MCTTKRKVVRNRARRSPCELPLARPPVPGAVGQLGPVAALVGLCGGMGRQGIPRLGRGAVRGCGLCRDGHDLGGARFVRRVSARLVGFDDPGVHGHCQTK